MKSNKGFTLIELLVVIAIIGILSSVVLASLNTARDKGADAAIKGNINGIRAQAELYYDSNGNKYNTSSSTECISTTGVFSDGNIKAAMSSAKNAYGGDTPALCTSSITGWVVNVPLKTAGTYCVDGRGNATSTTAISAIGDITDGSCL